MNSKTEKIPFRQESWISMEMLFLVLMKLALAINQLLIAPSIVFKFFLATLLKLEKKQHLKLKRVTALALQRSN